MSIIYINGSYCSLGKSFVKPLHVILLGEEKGTRPQMTSHMLVNLIFDTGHTEI